MSGHMPHNLILIRIGWKGFSLKNTLAYRRIISDGGKKFYNVDGSFKNSKTCFDGP